MRAARPACPSGFAAPFGGLSLEQLAPFEGFIRVEAFECLFDLDASLCARH
jgi:hypothetical protein